VPEHFDECRGGECRPIHLSRQPEDQPVALSSIFETRKLRQQLQNAHQDQAPNGHMNQHRVETPEEQDPIMRTAAHALLVFSIGPPAKLSIDGNQKLAYASY
jgi:hypothetical protein